MKKWMWITLAVIVVIIIIGYIWKKTVKPKWAKTDPLAGKPIIDAATGRIMSINMPIATTLGGGGGCKTGWFNIPYDCGYLYGQGAVQAAK